MPTLYLSRFIVENKGDYYRLLQHVRNTGEWEEWLLYMLKGVEQTARQTIELVKQIKILMQDHKQRIRTELPKIYSQDLLNNLFRHPYTKIEFLATELNVSTRTSRRYLDDLVEKGFLEKVKFANTIYYVNQPLFAIFIKRS